MALKVSTNNPNSSTQKNVLGFIPKPKLVIQKLVNFIKKVIKVKVNKKL
jgi:hypothetical protein